MQNRCGLVVFSHHLFCNGVAVRVPVLFGSDRNHQDAIAGNVSSQGVQRRMRGLFT